MARVTLQCLPRFGALESLRGIAALIVVVGHAYWLNPLSQLKFFLNYYLMVDFFFCLSGFVISHAYERKLICPTDGVRFMWLRWGRLFPVHLIMIGLFLMYAMGEYILETIRGHSGMEAARIYSMYTLVLNMVFLTFLENKINAPSWSAGVDFYLYILFVLIVIVFRKRTIRVLTYSLLIVATYVYMYLFCTNMSLWVSGSQAYVRGVAGFFGGVLGYQLYKNYMEGNDKSINSTRIVKVVSWTLLFVIISVLSFKQPGGSDFYMLPIFALFIVSLTVDVDGLISKYLQSKFLQLLGAISYSLYMSHLLISRIISLPAYKGYLSGIVPQDSLIVTEYNASLSFAFTMVYIIASLLFAHRLYHLVEAPCRSRSRELADQWFGREACIPTNTATDSE